MNNYMVYVTANDEEYFMADFLNFLDMKRLSPGVGKIQLYIAMSKIKEINSNKLNNLLNIFIDSSWIEVRSVIIKGNIGRDFSSIESCLDEIRKEAKPEDNVLIKNRSGYGPLMTNWYKEYLQQYLTLKNGGIVGSTINFTGHPQGKIKENTTHIQTYTYFMKFKEILSLYPPFPASDCTDRVELIEEGEIGLTQKILNSGKEVTSLFWREYIFNKEYQNDKKLPQRDIKTEATNIPFVYKYKKRFRSLKYLPFQLLWFLKQNSTPRSENKNIRYVEKYDE